MIVSTLSAELYEGAEVRLAGQEEASEGEAEVSEEGSQQQEGEA